MHETKNWFPDSYMRVGVESIGHRSRTEAVRAVRLKRYLLLMGYEATARDTVQTLKYIVQGLHRDRVRKWGRPSRAWPVSLPRMRELLREHHYASNLLALKEMYGPSASVNILVSVPPGGPPTIVRCHTIADLVTQDLVPASLLYLDYFLAKVVAGDHISRTE